MNEGEGRESVEERRKGEVMEEGSVGLSSLVGLGRFVLSFNMLLRKDRFP